MPGPVPNRTEDLARPRERKGGDVQPVVKGVALETQIPEPDPNWHDIARLVWDGCVSSGQREFYQNSDWALLYSACDDLSEYKKAGRRSAQMAATVYSIFTNLLVTEGDRRRARIELSAPEEEQDDEAEKVMENYQGLHLVS